METTVTVLSLAVAIVLFASGVGHIRRPATLAKALRGLGAPRVLGDIASWAIPTVELLLGGLLIVQHVGGLGTHAPRAWSAAAALFAVYTIYQCGLLLKYGGNKVPCGCDSVAEDMANGWTTARAAGLAIVATFCAVQPPEGVDVVGTSSNLVIAATWFAAGVMAVLWWLLPSATQLPELRTQVGTL